MNAARARSLVSAALLALGLASLPAQACSPGHRYTPEELVDAADGIYRVRADGLGTVLAPESDDFLPWPSTHVRFAVLQTLKGDAQETLVLNGELVADADPNDHPPPYGFVRPGGRHGNCFATGYVDGRQYLLFLRRGEIYWAALAPANEEVTGAMDPWVTWVQQRLMLE